MIKKFNENWGTFEDYLDANEKPEESFETINVKPGDRWDDVYKRAKNLAIMKNKKVKYVFQNITHIVTGKTDKDKLFNDFSKNFGKGGNITIEGESEPEKSLSQKWKEYWDKYSENPNIEMDTVAIYAKKHSISYEEALEILSRYENENEPEEPRPPVKFSKGTEVIGLPSGQVIYMSLQAIKYFKARNLITYKKTWKKPIDGGLIPIDINQYTFEDKFLNNILDQIDVINFT